MEGFDLPQIDDDFISENKQEKVSKIPIVEYSPKIDNRLWFRLNKENNNNVNISESLRDASNLNQVDKNNRKSEIKSLQYSINQYYIQSKYEECCQELEKLDQVMFYKKSKDYSDEILEIKVRCLYRLVKYKELIETIDKWEESLSNRNKKLYNPNILQLKASSYQYFNQFDKATEYYYKTLQINRRVWDWWFNLSLVYINSKFQLVSFKEFNENLSNSTINIKNILQQIEQIPIKSRILSKLSLCRSSFLISQTIFTKKQLNNNNNFTNIIQQLSKIKSFIDQLIKDIETIDKIETTQDYIKLNRTEFIEFEIKWLIDFNLESLENEEQEIEKREDNPMSL